MLLLPCFCLWKGCLSSSPAALPQVGLMASCLQDVQRQAGCWQLCHCSSTALLTQVTMLLTRSLGKSFLLSFFLKFLLYFIFKILLIFGCTGSSLLFLGLSLVPGSRDYSLLWCSGFSLRKLFLSQSMGSGEHRLQ